MAALTPPLHIPQEAMSAGRAVSALQHASRLLCPFSSVIRSHLVACLAPHHSGGTSSTLDGQRAGYPGALAHTALPDEGQ